MINPEKLIGCTKEIIALADVLDSFAKQKGTELIVTSGKRSAEENQACGGSKNSWHLVGKAIDIAFKDTNHFKLVTELYYKVAAQEGVFKGVTEFEVVKDKTGKQHFHFAISGITTMPFYFTGIYK